MEKFQYKFKEDEILKEFLGYLNNTYKSHYSMPTKQTIEFFHEFNPELAKYFSLGNILKYIMRFGKKEGKKKEDLFKAIHYIIFLFYFEFYKGEQTNGDPS